VFKISGLPPQMVCCSLIFEGGRRKVAGVSREKYMVAVIPVESLTEGALPVDVMMCKVSMIEERLDPPPEMDPEARSLAVKATFLRPELVVGGVLTEPQEESTSETAKPAIRPPRKKSKRGDSVKSAPQPARKAPAPEAEEGVDPVALNKELQTARTPVGSKTVALRQLKYL